MKVAITGGHLTPALAVLSKLKEVESGVQIVYFGRKYSFEDAKTVSKDFTIVSHIKGVTYYNLDTGRLQRIFSARSILSLLKIPGGFFQAIQILKKEKPDVIMSFGGYLAFPVVLGAFFLNIPVVTHEQTITVGLANKFIALFAKKVLLGFEQSLSYFPKKKSMVIGNPLRVELTNLNQKKYLQLPDEFRTLFKDKEQNPKRKLLYITGGNQGAHVINAMIWELLPALTKKYYLIHQCGERDFQEVKKGKIIIPEHISERYLLIPYVEADQIGFIYAASDLVIGRSGANTVYELAALGKAALFIPIPWVVNNEQQKNAELLSNAGSARIISQNNLKSEKLLQVIEECIESLSDYQKKALELQKTIKKDAAEQAVSVIMETVSLKDKVK